MEFTKENVLKEIERLEKFCRNSCVVPEVVMFYLDELRLSLSEMR